MKRIIWGTAITAAAMLSIAAFRGISATDPAAEATARVQRGQYLVAAIGCEDCHTPKKMGVNGPEPDLSRMLSGHPEGTRLPAPPAGSGPWAATATWDLTAWSGPWGVSYAMNITPDENTGIGIWTEDMFVSALRTGRHMGVSRPILPPMPWQAFRNLADDDLKAIYSYLRTITPVHNRVPEPMIAAEPAN
jgi:hypothetical protein